MEKAWKPNATICSAERRSGLLKGRAPNDFHGKIESIHAEYKIYTDGSTDANQENGGAGIYIEDALGTVVREESVATWKLCLSYTEECVAFLRALEWSQQQEEIRGEPQITLVSSDSMSLVDALKSNNWKNGDPWLKQIKQMSYNLTLLWIPSHCVIPGNERADELANKG